MKLIHTENLLNQSAFKKLPRGTVKELFVRFAGVAQGGKTVALTDLGTFRVNVRGTDRHNGTFRRFNSLTNLKMGVAEASSTPGGSFSFAAVIPFHAWWDDRSGEYFGIDEAFFEARFPNFDSTLIVSGTVSVYVIEAPQVSTYTMSILQRNIQAGGAGQVAQVLEIPSVSSIYIGENANLNTIQVTTDQLDRGSMTQADAKSYSNSINRVETAIDLIEINLNPYNEIRSNLNKEVKLILNTTSAANIEMLVEAYSLLPSKHVEESTAYLTSVGVAGDQV